MYGQLADMMCGLHTRRVHEININFDNWESKRHEIQRVVIAKDTATNHVRIMVENRVECHRYCDAALM